MPFTEIELQVGGGEQKGLFGFFVCLFFGKMSSSILDMLNWRCL